MQTTTPDKIKDLNLRVWSELKRIEAIVDNKLITDTGTVPIGTPPVDTEKSVLWTQKWNALIASINTYLNQDRTVPYQKLMMSVANHAMHKLDAALSNPVKRENLVDFGGLTTTMATKSAQTLLYTDLEAFKTTVDGAWEAEQAKIDTFSAAVTAILVAKGIEQILKNPATQQAVQGLGYNTGLSSLNHTLPL